MNILYKIASRGRPVRLNQTILSIVNNISIPTVVLKPEDGELIGVMDKNKGYHKMIVSLDEDDFTLRLYEERLLWWGIKPIIGSSGNKIGAINRDIPKEGWDILVNVSDDQVFTVKGFDDIIRSYFADGDTDKFLHFPDGNRTDLCTMSIIGRDYYNRDKYIYHPDYVGYFCDQEAQDVAKLRGKYIYCDHQIFRHEHPDYGLAQRDRLYQEYQRFFEQDKATYEKRRNNNFE